MCCFCTCMRHIHGANITRMIPCEHTNTHIHPSSVSPPTHTSLYIKKCRQFQKYDKNCLLFHILSSLRSWPSLQTVEAVLSSSVCTPCRRVWRNLTQDSRRNQSRLKGPAPVIPVSSRAACPPTLLHSSCFPPGPGNIARVDKAK